MGSRTIDEGAIDEKSGMNFSEYVAVLSGNTDLLDKADVYKRQVPAHAIYRKMWPRRFRHSSGT